MGIKMLCTTKYGAGARATSVLIAIAWGSHTHQDCHIEFYPGRGVMLFHC